MMKFTSNPQIDLAFDYVRNTNRNIFLTGKAGTGKTTFLHQIKKEGAKRIVVVAPTGVAAINAGGMTIHSFFQLPFGLHLPGSTRDESRQRRFSSQKINLIKSLDLLVIDEISMVRADLLDSVDEVLRRYRDFSRPFGGVQLLMIGDLHQLPPVVKQEEWELLRQHYTTPYFFGSIALQKTHPVAIELKHIYRQSDSLFIDLLNRVRDNKMDADVLEMLNSRYRSDFQPPDEEAYITLTAHNAAAHQINAEKLASLHGPSHFFTAKIEGDFPPMSYPTEEKLEFKTGAQVMFVKNDTGPDKLYYNGKIGQVSRIEEDVIYVRCPNDAEIAVTALEWQNMKYSLDEKSKEVKEESIGSFTQIPLKLAWAITIHKSQGLTFERAIIDAQAAFAHGQVYVALSRCKSFEGIVLRSKIAHSSVKTDSVVKQYTEDSDKNAPDEAHLQQSKREYQQALIFELFDFKALRRYFDQMNRILLEHENTLSTALFSMFKIINIKAENDLFNMAAKFIPQLKTYFAQPEMPEENENLRQRLQKASIYFSDKLMLEVLPDIKKIQFVTDNKAVRKTALDALDNLQKEIFVKNSAFVICKTAFSTQQYMRAKTNAEIDYLAAKSAAQPAAAFGKIPRDIPHPDLYAILLKWREEMADAFGTDPYEVLPVRSLHELVTYLPIDTVALKKIKGIGEIKIRQFGKDITSIIQKYCSARHITVNLLTATEPPKLPKTDTKTISFDLFKSGKNIAEIAAERGMVAGTIEGHLAYFVGIGELDISSLMAPENIAELTAFFINNNTTSSPEAKAHFGDKYSYSQLRMVMTHLKQNPV